MDNVKEMLGGVSMNPMKLLMLAITFMQLNAGQTAEGKKIIKEALDVIQVLGKVMKDKKITSAEKKAVVKELREFSKSAIDFVDGITIPE